jgi:peptidoglycan/xylan/chitin deacetylase (PgdA/CDA1 family)
MKRKIKQFAPSWLKSVSLAPVSRFLARAMDAKMTSNSSASAALGINGMTRSVLFFTFFFLISVALALLYTFGFPRIFVGLLSFITIFIVYLLFHPRNQWLVANRSRVDGACLNGKSRVALTFDDGPDPVYTPKLLDLLREKDVKATFFVIGKRADQYPEIVRRAWAEGHLIGNHTWSHYPLFCFLMPGRLRAEIERGTESIRRSCGFRSTLFRSPVGLRHPLLAPYLENAGLEYVSWSIRTLDTFTTNSSVLAQRILSRAKSGDIILLHDSLPRGTDVMLEALPRVIDELRGRGFEFVLAGPREDAKGTLEVKTCEPVR